MKITKNKKIGEIGETIAADFLKQNGYKIVEKNFLTKVGEIDIVSMDKNEYVFVEVKTSKYYPNSVFNPEFRVNKKKLNNIAKACEIYCIKNMFQLKQKWRVDVISIIIDDNFVPIKIEHLKNILFE